MTKLTVYQRIVRAANRGTGMRLSADDVFLLSINSAIRATAEEDSDEYDWWIDDLAAPKGDDEATRSALEGNEED